MSSRRCHALSILGDCDHMSTGSEQQRRRLVRRGSKRDVLQDSRERAFYLSSRATRELVISSIESNASYSRTEEACTASIKLVPEERKNTSVCERMLEAAWCWTLVSLELYAPTRNYHSPRGLPSD